ncbi:hypothetical protein FSARC_9845 [Fusarium sarcochroum]|uniref:Apple domain-containing protein n=1 Tax=Fusarium sarcochroum TaxID=1208366 RepID=A0A8H4TQ58_9HYPO|nr:hypothetical protein FSARC_9845 [Fusarium sarcochroum]
MQSMIALAGLALANFAVAGPCKPARPATTSALDRLSLTETSTAAIDTTTGISESSTDIPTLTSSQSTTATEEADIVITNTAIGGSFAKNDPNNPPSGLTGFGAEGDAVFHSGGCYKEDGSVDDGCAALSATGSPAGKRDMGAFASIFQTLNGLNIGSRKKYTVQFFYAVLTGSGNQACSISASLGSSQFYSSFLFSNGPSASWVQVLQTVEAESSSAAFAISMNCFGNGMAVMLVDSVFISNQVTPENIGDFKLDFGAPEPNTDPKQVTSSQAEPNPTTIKSQPTEEPRNSSDNDSNTKPVEPTSVTGDAPSTATEEPTEVTVDPPTTHTEVSLATTGDSNHNTEQPTQATGGSSNTNTEEAISVTGGSSNTGAQEYTSRTEAPSEVNTEDFTSRTRGPSDENTEEFTSRTAGPSEQATQEPGTTEVATTHHESQKPQTTLYEPTAVATDDAESTKSPCQAEDVKSCDPVDFSDGGDNEKCDLYGEYRGETYKLPGQDDPENRQYFHSHGECAAICNRLPGCKSTGFMAAMAECFFSNSVVTGSEVIPRNDDGRDSNWSEMKCFKCSGCPSDSNTRNAGSVGTKIQGEPIETTDFPSSTRDVTSAPAKTEETFYPTTTQAPADSEPTTFATRTSQRPETTTTPADVCLYNRGQTCEFNRYKDHSDTLCVWAGLYTGETWKVTREDYPFQDTYQQCGAICQTLKNCESSGYYSIENRCLFTSKKIVRSDMTSHPDRPHDHSIWNHNSCFTCPDCVTSSEPVTRGWMCSYEQGDSCRRVNSSKDGALCNYQGMLEGYIQEALDRYPDQSSPAKCAAICLTRPYCKASGYKDGRCMFATRDLTPNSFRLDWPDHSRDGIWDDMSCFECPGCTE